jgi:hypothetical protein
MYRIDNPFFVAREAELSLWRARLADSAPLAILNVYGHSGVGKTWLLGAFRDTCREAQVPFAQFDAYRLGDDLSPGALLTNLANQLALEMETANVGDATFDQILPQLVTALADAAYPVVVLMVDDYDQLFHLVDPWLRNLFRAVRGQDQFTGPPSRRPDVSLETLPRILAVINSHEPLTQRWPPNPLYHQALEKLQLVDFSFEETCDYLIQRDIAEEHHWQLFRLTQGHPLTLALVVSLCEEGTTPDVVPEASGEVMRHVLTWALRDIDDEAGDTQTYVTEMLRASAVVRRFNQPLLAAMLGQVKVPDERFDQVAALSMVTERKRSTDTTPRMFNGERQFILHEVLRAALLEDAQNRGLGEQADTYRRRALMFYAQQLSESDDATLGEKGLDLLFLHRDSLMRDMFFGWSSAPLAPDRVSYEEIEGVLEPLMRDNIYYQVLGFEGESLERLIAETKEWLALDREMNGDSLHYFRVVRRSGQESIAGFTLNVPITKTTLPLLRRETMGAVYETGCGPLELCDKTRAYFSLRLVADGLDSFSALLRTIFVEMANQSFEVLLTAMPWPQLPEVLKTMGFDTLAHQVEYEGYQYDVVQLDVGRRGGATSWLFRLVREDLGLPPRSLLQDWSLFKEMLQEALGDLHGSFNLLAKSPLIDEFTLADRAASDWERAKVLTKALQETLETMRLPEAYDRPDAAFHILNERYGIVGDAWQRFEFGPGRPSVDEVAQAVGCSKGTLYNRLDEALEAFARAFRRKVEEH